MTPRKYVIQRRYPFDGFDWGNVPDTERDDYQWAHFELRQTVTRFWGDLCEYRLAVHTAAGWVEA